MRTGVLRGREHTDLGAISAIAEGRVAVAISLGGAKKPYAHKEPNEDAAGFAVGAGGALLAIADGHAGAGASQGAIDWLLAQRAGAWTGAGPDRPWEEAVRDVVAELQTALVAAGASAESARARTTLALALVRPGEDRAAWASIGDSLVFSVGAETRELDGRPDPAEFFLANPRHEPGVLAARVRCGEGSLAGLRALALATDGLSEHGIGVVDPPAAVAEAVGAAEAEPPGLRPLTAARGIARRALDAHQRQRAGDNVAVAVYWADSD